RHDPARRVRLPDLRRLQAFVHHAAGGGRRVHVRLGHRPRHRPAGARVGDHAVVAPGGPVIAAVLAAGEVAREPTNAWQWLTDSSTREISHSIPHNLWLTIEHAGAGSL